MNITKQDANDFHNKKITGVTAKSLAEKYGVSTSIIYDELSKLGASAGNSGRHQDVLLRASKVIEMLKDSDWFCVSEQWRQSGMSMREFAGALKHIGVHTHEGFKIQKTTIKHKTWWKLVPCDDCDIPTPTKKELRKVDTKSLWSILISPAPMHYQQI